MTLPTLYVLVEDGEIITSEHNGQNAFLRKADAKGTRTRLAKKRAKERSDEYEGVITTVHDLTEEQREILKEERAKIDIETYIPCVTDAPESVDSRYHNSKIKTTCVKNVVNEIDGVMIRENSSGNKVLTVYEKEGYNFSGVLTDEVRRWLLNLLLEIEESDSNETT